MNTPQGSGAFCPYFHHAIELIGRRWTGAILRALAHGTDRFSTLVETIPGLSDRMLSERLKELEAEGIVQRTVIPETPVRITYHLTEKGDALGSVLDAIGQWAQEWLVAEVQPALATAATHAAVTAGDLTPAPLVRSRCNDSVQEGRG